MNYMCTYVYVYLLWGYTPPLHAITMFLRLFDEHKAAKGGSLKFIKDFLMTVVHTDEVRVGTTEDYYSMGQILDSFGQKTKDFDSVEEAIDATRHLCRKNAEEHGWSLEAKPESIDKEYPMFSKFWFVMSKGKETSNISTTKKQLSQNSGLKGVGQLEQAMVFMEGVGFKDGEEEKGEGKIENVKHEELAKQVELLKISYVI